VIVQHHLFFHLKSNKFIILNKKNNEINISRVRVTGRVQCSSTRKQTIRYTDSEKKNIQRFEVEPNTEYSVYVTPGVYIFSVG